MPEISVLLSVYNGRNFLRQSIESILNQTFRDFEFIIINDGSTDDSPEIIRSYNDPRIQFINFSENRGLAHSLNQGIEHSSGRYIVRQDADDISFNRRLEIQHRFMDANPDIGISGANAVYINENGIISRTSSMPETDVHVRWYSLLGTPFIHPSVIIRRDILFKNRLQYDPSLRYVQDYALWLKVLNITKGRNLKKPLLYYRRPWLNAKEDSSFKIGAELAYKNIIQKYPELSFNTETVKNLRTLFMAGRKKFPDVVNSSVFLSEQLLKLYKRFISDYSYAETAAIRRKIALDISKIIIQHPFKSGNIAIFMKCLHLNPLLFSDLFMNALNKIFSYRFPYKIN